MYSQIRLGRCADNFIYKKHETIKEITPQNYCDIFFKNLNLSNFFEDIDEIC